MGAQARQKDMGAVLFALSLETFCTVSGPGRAKPVTMLASLPSHAAGLLPVNEGHDLDCFS